MSFGFEVRGGRELRRITKGLREVGDGREIKKRFTKELRAAAKPLVPAVRASILAIPTSGSMGTGLRRRIARAVRLTVRTTGRSAGVSIAVDGRKMLPGEGALPAYMEGTKKPWRHPVFGGDTWVTQTPRPYFYRVVRPLGQKSRTAVNKVLDEVTKDIT